ncbi:hypothetical protein Tco_0598903 [Tanacetum coccineum]
MEDRSKRKQKKKVSSVKLGRNKEEGTLSEEHYVQDDYTADPFFEDIVDKDAAVTPDLERKSDETEEINIEEKEASNVKSGDTGKNNWIWRTMLCDSYIYMGDSDKQRMASMIHMLADEYDILYLGVVDDKDAGSLNGSLMMK